MVALSLEIGGDEIDGFCDAVEQFVERRRSMLTAAWDALQ
jgi:hypothetical protein